MLTTCRWTDRSDDGEDEVCESVADGGEIFIRSRTGTAKVPVCLRHRAVHNERAAALRTKSRT